MVEHRQFSTLEFQTVIGTRPDALKIVDLAQAVTRAAARPVALVLGALRFRAEVRDVGQRTVTTVLAVK